MKITCSQWSAVALFVHLKLLYRDVAAKVPHTSSEYKMFCYYGSYAQSRPDGGKFLPEDIDPTLCSHIIFAFADLVQATNLKSSNWNDLPNGKDTGLYARTLDLKLKQPSLKVLLAVGGWRAGSDPFVPMISTEENRKAFIRNSIRFLRRHNFDGLDLDWEFPGTRGSGTQDKYLYTQLIEEMQKAFMRESKHTGNTRLLLTMAVSGGSYYINLAYEPQKIGKLVDYLLIMGYNYHGSWNEYTGHHSGLFSRSDEIGGEKQWNQAWSVDFWLNVAKVPRQKLILGVATYGMTYTLATAAQHGLKAAATGAGDPGKYTQESGILAYYEICENVHNDWKSVWIEEQKVPYAYHEDQWVSYDNMDSMTYKANYIIEKGLGGSFIWSLEMDDFKGTCGSGPYPLLFTISNILKDGRKVEIYNEDKYNNIGKKQISFSNENKATDTVDEDSYSSRKSINRFDKKHSLSDSVSNSDDNLEDDFIDYTKPTAEELGTKRLGSADDYYNSQKSAVKHDPDTSLYISESTKYSNVREQDRHSSEFGQKYAERERNIPRERLQHVRANDREDVSLPKEYSSQHRFRSTQRESREDDLNDIKPSNVPTDNFSKFGFARVNNSSSHDSRTHRPVYSDSRLKSHPRHDESKETTNKIDGYNRKREDMDVRGRDELDYEEKSTRQPIQRGNYHHQHPRTNDVRNIERPIEKSKPNQNKLEDESGGLKCERAGLFPQPSSCRSYFICVPHGTNWYKFQLTCPEGLAFRTDNAACGRVDDCKD